MTSLTCTVTPDDYVAYTVHLSGKPPFLRGYCIRSLLNGAIFAIVVVAVAMMAGDMSRKEPVTILWFILPCVIAGEVAVWFLAAPIQRAQVRAAARATLGPGAIRHLPRPTPA